MGYSVFTSNVDGHFLRAQFAEHRVVECHGSIHFLQAFNPRISQLIWPAAPDLAGLRIDSESFLADEETLPYFEPGSGLPRALARPNILMFDDNGWIGDRTETQERRRAEYLASLPTDCRMVVLEIGAGLAVPSVRYTSEAVLDEFPRATLLRVNPAEPRGPLGRTIEIAEPGLRALRLLDKAIGGAAGVGSASLTV